MFNTPNLAGLAAGIMKTAGIGRAAIAAGNALEESYNNPKSWTDYLAYPLGAAVAATRATGRAAGNVGNAAANAVVGGVSRAAGSALHTLGADETARAVDNYGTGKLQNANRNLRAAGGNALQAARHAANTAVIPVRKGAR